MDQSLTAKNAEAIAPPRRRLAALASAAGLLAVVVRLPFLTHLPPTWDSVQYVLGILHYDVALHQPHPPGYFLYVYAAKVLHWIGLSPYSSLLVISLLAGALMAALLTWWAGRLAGTTAALATGALTLASPLAWNYATQGDTYAVSGLSSALVAYLCWRFYRDRRTSVFPSAIALAIATGLRPTDGLFLFPLWLYCVGRRGVKPLVVGLVSCAVVSLAWLLPLLYGVGGWAHYLRISGRLSAWAWSESPLAGTWYSLRLYLVAVGVSIVSILFVGWLFLPMGGGTKLTRRPFFIALWIIPATFFYLMVHFATLGYLMLLAPPFLLLAGIGLARLLNRVGGGRAVVLLVVVVLMNGLFLADTMIMPRQQQERERREIATACLPYAGPGSVALATFTAPTVPTAERNWLPYRIAMYLLPDVHVFVFPLEAIEWQGYHPSYGYQLQSALVTPPVVMPGVHHLLLLDRRLLKHLPPDTPRELIISNREADVYHVPLDPTVPLVLGTQGKLTLCSPQPSHPSG